MYKICVYSIIIIILFTNFSANCHENSNDEDDLFVPTHEWQIVKKGQKIPKGLHVRVNFETGITEAKILDENDPTEKANAVVQVPDAENSNFNNPAKLKYSQQELKEAIKNIKNDANKEYVKRIQNTFRSYEELKKDLGEYKINPKTDTELLKELITYHNEIKKTKENERFIMAILEDLEYLVHQIDNANDFVTLNGFVTLVYPSLNSTSAEIKASSLKVLGACVQNNAKVQIHALETGAVGILLKVLVLNSDSNIKNRAIFALGGLMRRFPLAQLKFIENAGLIVFGELLQKSTDIKLHLKIITLINDLHLEHVHALQDLNNVNYVEKVQQYNAINLHQKLKDQDWCPYLIGLLENVVTVNINDHDSIEKTLNAIIELKICKIQYRPKLQKLVLELQNYYKILSLNDEDKYFQNLYDLCKKIILPLKHKSEL